MDFSTIFKVDAAICQHKLRSQHLAFLSSDYFYFPRLTAICRNLNDPDGDNPYVDTQRLRWLLARDVKVREIEFACNCPMSDVSNYLEKFGEHVQGVAHFTRKFYAKDPAVFLRANKQLPTDTRKLTSHTTSHGLTIAAHCQNLTSYQCHMLGGSKEGFARVLLNNPGLQKLKIEGNYWGSLLPHTSLSNLRQLEIVTEYSFVNVLPVFARVAPNLEKLLLKCKSIQYKEISSALILSFAKGCPKLRSFSARRLHLGARDQYLMQFFQMCPSMVNLDLRLHLKLTDNTLIAALSCLNELRSINLRGCEMLSDHTLLFLSERFAHTLQVLYLGDNNGMSSGAIETLRTECSKLHTLHYVYYCRGGGDIYLMVDKLSSTTILSALYVSDAATLTALAEHCQQLQVIDFSKAVQVSERELMQVAQNCPKLHTVVLRNGMQTRLDYSSVKKAFPKLVFTTDKVCADCDVLAMPV